LALLGGQSSGSDSLGRKFWTLAHLGGQKRNWLPWEYSTEVLIPCGVLYILDSGSPRRSVKE
jgi:hypothetical protein